jgi:endonuclease/exonuclease/phosphatase family metal-dependent hydrolase
MKYSVKKIAFQKSLSFLFIFLVFVACHGSKNKGSKEEKEEELKIVTWNLYNFGRSKDDNEIDFIAEKMRDFDIFAVQEVSKAPSGAQAVARLADALNRKGAKWAYQTSEATDGKGTERYAFLWKTSKVKLVGKLWLVSTLGDKIAREPCMARFETKAKNQLLLANFHAIPKSKHPENEVVLLKKLPEFYPNDKLIILGDFNLSQKHEAFDELKNLNYTSSISNQRTSLKMKVKDSIKLAQEYDNIFFDRQDLEFLESGVIHFYEDFKTLKEARKISDHIPVWVKISFNSL